MVEAIADDGQRLLALNEIYRATQLIRQRGIACILPGETPEAQASSGLIVATGTGDRVVPIDLAGTAQHPGTADTDGTAAGLVRPGGVALAGHRHQLHRR